MIFCGISFCLMLGLILIAFLKYIRFLVRSTYVFLNFLDIVFVYIPQPRVAK